MDGRIQTTTQVAIQAVIQADVSIDAQEKARLVRFLFSTGTEAQADTGEQQERIIRRNEAAKRLAVSPRMVDYYGKRGILSRVTLGGQSRASGYRESEIQAIIAGRSS